jgi:hypothetical protein
VVAVRPTNMKQARAEAYEMIGSPDSGRFWHAYWDAFAQAWPDFWRFC